jgi:tetratricopeptide (TPR) repeat protein
MQRKRKRPSDAPALAVGSPLPSVKARPPDGGAPDPRSARHGHWFFGFLLIAATFLAYLPALRGDFVWDDATWTTNLSALFQNASGLHLIWFQPTVLQQYYPLSGTTFWLDYQLWKFWTTPYHVENVLLHALAALLFWRLLLRLRVPGAWLAAALFALHPVMVESAAWITERKNVLSLPLYLGALLAYERYARCAQCGTGGKWQVAETKAVAAPSAPSSGSSHPSLFYGVAFFLFLGALLAKTTAFSLPAAILLIGWWQRGRIRWRADVLPTLPFFALALGLSAMTAWLEKNHVGAQGADFALTFPQRCLVAGRVFWFYLGKLFWPAQLCFVYPRWQPNPGVWWQWLYPVTAAGTLFALWLARRRIGRGPITAMFFFVGTLFPVLGFMNAYFMRYSFVCDHWVYLSSLGVLAWVAALVVRAAEQLRRRGLVYGFAAIVLPVLGLLTWRQAGVYQNMETLWLTTIARNPDCWMAQNNLGAWYFARRRPAEAETLYRKALQLNPGYAEAFDNLGTALAAQGKLAEAIQDFDQALQLKPGYAEGHYNLGVAWASQGKWAEAIQQYEQALQLKPDNVDALNNLGIALASQGKLADAIQHFEQALQLKPDNAAALDNLGTALAIQGKLAEAIQHFDRVLQLKPDYAGAHYFLGITLASQGKSAEAILHFQQALALAAAQGNTALAASIRKRLDSYPPALLQPQTP